MRTTIRYTVLLAFLGLGFTSGLASEGSSQVNLRVNTSQPAGSTDLTRYALRQGGVSDRPRFSDRVGQIAQLHPQPIRLFVQAYFDLYPADGKDPWEALDKAIEAILATG